MLTSSPTIKDLLRLACSEPVAWLAGAGNGERPVQWVAASIQEAQPGDVLLVLATEMTKEILSRAQEKELAGILILGEAPLPEGFGGGDLIVAAVPQYQGSLRSIQRSLITFLINQRAALVERGGRFHAQLSQLEAEGKGLEGLVEAMASISGRGVLVQDKRGNILAEHPSKDLLAIWVEILDHLTALDSLPEPLLDRKRSQSQVTLVNQAIPGGLERLVAPIIVGGVTRGYLSLLGLGGEFDALDNLVVEQGMLVCAIDMARNKAIREAEKRLKGDLLTAVLQDNLSPRDARLWAQTMGLDLLQAHAALRFAWDSQSAPSRRRLETLINGEITQKQLKVIVNPMGNEVICFCEVPPGTNRPDPALALGQAVFNQGQHEYPDLPIRCGIGTPAQGLSDWRISFRQAGQALEMARRLDSDRPLYYADLSIYRLLFQIEHNPELIAFYEEILGPLLAYEGVSELINTLEAYFEHNANLSQTAEALYIHRNTLIYRIERIANITGMDLDKPENRLALQLALRIYRMMGPRSGTAGKTR